MSAASATAKKASKLSWFRALLPPLVGFGIGWGGYSIVESSGLVDERRMLQTHCFNLKAQRLVRRYAPTQISDTLCMPQENLDAMIAVLENAIATGSSAGSAQTESDRVPFSKILQECRVQEQLEWLSDHLLEDVPYFYIADIFHSWAEIHEPTVLSASIAPRKDAIFDSKLICDGVWKKMIDDVIPFDVSVRVLAVLATCGVQNAKWIASLTSSKSLPSDSVSATANGAVADGPVMDAAATILSLQRRYHESLKTNKREGGDVVPSAAVDKATAALLLAMNDSRVHGRRFPWIGSGSAPSGPYPLFKDKQLNDEWCRFVRGRAAWEDENAHFQGRLEASRTALCS